MRFLTGAIALAMGILAPSAVMAAPSASLEGRDLAGRAAATCNTPTNRACWTDGFDINTDYEASTPPSGTTRTYTLTLTEVDQWTGPDGVVKEKVMLVNGNILGPTIVADWGDNIEVQVINNLRTNGTSIHWHGMRMLGTNLHDGVNGVTQCPIPPNGGSFTYKFRATQYGTSWYHSHFSAQYGNGVVGSIQINGPASQSYDIDLGVFPISDYYYRTADELVEFTKTNGPPASDNVLFNGTNVHPVTGAGAYANVTLTPGKRHRLRIINPSTENHFQLSLVGHNMTIIATDLVPVQPKTVSSLFVGVGQRFDVTIDANQTPGNYWFNATYSATGLCGGSNNPAPAAIFSYAGAPSGLPTNPGTAPTDSLCLDNLNLTPVVPRTVSLTNFVPSPNNLLVITTDVVPTFVWRVNGSSINVDWNKPVADYVLTGNTSYPRSENLVQVDSVNQWTFWFVENGGPLPLPHPLHLHGHDFVVLSRSSPNTDLTLPISLDLLKTNNPVRRDVTMIPSLGWVLIAFKSDNPGQWLMHCHIAWHVAGGLSVDFLERPNDFRSSVPADDVTAFNDLCAAWDSYYPANDPYLKNDSGLKLVRK